MLYKNLLVSARLSKKRNEKEKVNFGIRHKAQRRKTNFSLLVSYCGFTGGSN